MRSSAQNVRTRIDTPARQHFVCPRCKVRASVAVCARQIIIPAPVYDMPQKARRAPQRT
ncbi:hypothetical protein Micbo1qcDRAFT_168405 [Microdochium bolleyi]|uniref:Uncharacterized protein n=1 Tax=Microdochium bolleyi TaxID=196109 RepID=A0A136INW0_9PEZI|nr:hypothetical protein Micbo1qcDRAFT_168405 [Microdochium bolleyi]